MATPFTATIQVLGNGGVVSYNCSVSDVVNGKYIFQDGEGNVVLPTNRGVLKIVDIILSGAGADTTQGEIFINGKTTGTIIQNASNLGSVFNRQFMGAGIAIAPGAKLLINQIA